MMPPTSSLLSYYAFFSTSMMLLRDGYREIVPKKLETYLVSNISGYLSSKLPLPSRGTYIIDDSWGGFRHNALGEAATVYSSNQIGARNKTARVGKFKLQDELTFRLVQGEEIVDEFDGIEVAWEYIVTADRNGREWYDSKDNYFQLTFRDKVLNGYLVHVMEEYKALNEEESVLQLYPKDEEYALG